jgi:hypothetical protein
MKRRRARGVRVGDSALRIVPVGGPLVIGPSFIGRSENAAWRSWKRRDRLRQPGHADANCDGALNVRELDTFDARLASLLASLRAVGSWSAGEVVRDMTLALVHQPSIRASFSG